MKFNELDKDMRVFETSLDQYIIPGIYIIARLDGRGFTKLTKETLTLDKPFDLRFRDAMTKTVSHLMQTGFRITYGYNQSDEISLLLHQEDKSFERKTRKIISILAGEASAKFSIEIGHVAAFDCRLSLLPDEARVIDYLRWRNEDAHRNSLNACCYWKLRESGKSVKEATGIVSGKTVAEKNELLFNMGINYNDLPSWQKRGFGCYFREEKIEAINPVSNSKTQTSRRKLYTELELPTGEAYNTLIKSILHGA
jgi:tRNA(His) guanylyltransferase